MTIGMQVGLDGIVKRKNHDKENGTAEPRKIRVQERPRFLKMLRREPVLFIRKINQSRRYGGDNARNAKPNEHGEDTDSHKHRKECRLRLPPVWQALRIEVRSHHARQLRVVVGKMNGRVERQQGENKFG